MKKTFTFSLLLLTLLACHRVPLTGRKSMSLIPENAKLGFDSIQRFPKH